MESLRNATCKVRQPTIPCPPGHAEDNHIRDVISSPDPPLLHARVRSRARQGGQSIAEFALVVPILLVLFVAIADFGRVFAAGIAVEAATRNAAEAAANEYLANPPPPGGDPLIRGDLSLAASGAYQPYYDNLRAYAAKVVCGELRSLPNTNYDPGPPPTCPDMPVVVVCVHDAADGGCGSKASPGSSGIPAECGDLTSAPTNAQATNADGTRPRSVEVRTCYHFTNILQLPLFAFGDVWLQRTRNFTIPCYFVLGTDECG